MTRSRPYGHNGYWAWGPRSETTSCSNGVCWPSTCRVGLSTLVRSIGRSPWSQRCRPWRGYEDLNIHLRGPWRACATCVPWQGHTWAWQSHLVTLLELCQLLKYHHFKHFKKSPSSESPKQWPKNGDTMLSSMVWDDPPQRTHGGRAVAMTPCMPVRWPHSDVVRMTIGQQDMPKNMQNGHLKGPHKHKHTRCSPRTTMRCTPGHRALYCTRTSLLQSSPPLRT